MTSMELRSVTLPGAGGRPVLDGVDLAVTSGATMALCGPAGAGKSAVLRVLVGLDDPVEGEVLLDDQDVSSVRPRGRDVAMVFQDFALHPHLDVHDNLAFATRLRRGHDKVALAERIDEVAAVLALDHLLDDKPAALEPAQRQRVSIGRVLVREAAAYLFDDPFSAQPDRVRPHVRSVTTQWQTDAGRTSLFTTDRPEEALSLASSVAVMHRGVVHQVGSPAELYDSPADLFVAAYLARPALNVLPAWAEGDVLRTPVASIPLGPHRGVLEDREHVLVGVRPEHCLPENDAAPESAVTIEASIDDIEWRGGSHLVHLGFDLAPEESETLETLEDDLDFDLFLGSFLVELPASPSLRPGDPARVVVAAEHLLFFDAETGVRLTGA